MGIYKAANKTGKYPKALHNLLMYAFGKGDEKTNPEDVIILGEYNQSEISANAVYKQFQETKELWNNPNGRQYFHAIHSFPENENITAQQAAAVTAELCEMIFPNHQVAVIPHHDKKHLDVHIIVNSVSYMNGKKLHLPKGCLEEHKDICNEICRLYGYSVPEKGKSCYGHDLSPDTVISWNKDTYQQLKKANPTHKASQTNIDMLQLALLILQALIHARSVQDFIEYMKRNAWKVTWQENRKNITFQSEKTGRKFRAANVDKTYGAKFRHVFGQDFVLDKEYMEKMCNSDPEHKKLLYGARADLITNEKKTDVKNFPKEPEKSKDPKGTWEPPKTEDKTKNHSHKKSKSKTSEKLNIEQNKGQT